MSPSWLVCLSLAQNPRPLLRNEGHVIGEKERREHRRRRSFSGGGEIVLSQVVCFHDADDATTVVSRVKYREILESEDFQSSMRPLLDKLRNAEIVFHSKRSRLQHEQRAMLLKS